MGQLGNQLFIIAATISLALDHGAEPLFPDLTTTQRENIPVNREQIFSLIPLNMNLAPFPLNYCYQEPYFHYAKIPYQPNMKLFGYFQSEKYFIHQKEKILQLFSPSKQIIDYLESKYDALIQNPATVAIHYRSYKKEDPNHDVFAACDMEYYLKAISQFPENSLFIVFSNDIDWCKFHFKTFHVHLFISKTNPIIMTFIL